jgi:CDP-6-deoxy-D-xylo-4-hexulose-3-dehydrase
MENGLSRISLISDTINKEDIDALCAWLQQDPTPQLTKGKLTVELEGRWAEMVGTKHSVFVNSGSSAILLLLAGLQQYKEKKLKVIVPALSWATDVSSPMLLGCDVILCDCNMKDLSCKLDDLEQLFKDTKPDVFISVAPLGLIPDMESIVNLCILYDVLLVEDVCESMGSKIGDRMLGSFGDASVFSMYYGHHLSTIEGGFINTNSDNLWCILTAMRSHGWARDWDNFWQQYINEIWRIGEFQSLYTFYYPGMNVRSTDLQAFIGLRMLDRLDKYCEKRNANFNIYNSLIKTNELELVQRNGEFISSFAYPMVNIRRKEIVKELRDNNIDVRPLIAGSIGEQPFWIKKYGRLKLPNASRIHKFGFYLPNHQDLSNEDILRIIEIVNKY